MAASPGLAGSTDWPHLRGPAFDGQVSGTELFSRGEAGLALAWRVPLGKGYSGIAVADGRAVTLYSDGTYDWAVAVDVGTGKEIWRHRIETTYKAHDGSDGGPNSTPVIKDGTVYGLGPKGGLFSLRLDDGKQLWSRVLPAEFGSTEPEYGFTTTPLVEDNILVVQTGGPDGHAISGLDARTGKTLWSLGDAEVEAQSPAILRLAGQRQVVAASGHQINGIDPARGKILWEHLLEDSDSVGSSSAMPLGQDRFLLLVGGAAAAFKVSKGDEGYKIEEVYRSRELGHTYALPVYHEGHLYGFKGQFLTCVDAETGKRVWKSRPPGGRGLILVDGHLVISAAQGNIVIAEASPEGYSEISRLRALDGTGLTWPSFAGGKVFVRNLSEMVAVNIVPGGVGSIEDARAATAVGSNTRFAAFVREVEAATNKQALVDGFLARHEQLPIIEGEYIHFIYTGEVEDIAISGNMIDVGSADPMERIEGTNTYYKTYRVEPASRWEYRFNVDFDERVLDSHNPNTVPSRWDDTGWSEVRLSDREAPSHIADPATERRGTIETFQFKSALLNDEREVRVYLPFGYRQGDSDYPLLVVHGLDWLEKGLLGNTLDNLIGKRVAPVVVAVVSPRQEWWREAGGTGTVEYVRMLATELVAHLQKKYRLRDDPASRAVMGNEGFGLTSAYATLKYPEVFGKVAVWSVRLGLGTDDALMDLIRARKGDGVQFYLDWNRYELRSADSGTDLREDALRLARALQENGYSYSGGEARDAHGWGSWRARTDRVLEAFFPLE